MSTMSYIILFDRFCVDTCDISLWFSVTYKHMACLVPVSSVILDFESPVSQTHQSEWWQESIGGVQVEGHSFVHLDVKLQKTSV